MATYKAATRIKFGGEQGKVKEFEVGQTVSGLEDKVMKDLLEAGAIVEARDWERLNTPVDTSSEVEEGLRKENESLQEEIVKLKAALAKATPPAPQK